MKILRQLDPNTGRPHPYGPPVDIRELLCRLLHDVPADGVIEQVMNVQERLELTVGRLVQRMLDKGILDPDDVCDVFNFPRTIDDQAVLKVIGEGFTFDFPAKEEVETTLEAGPEAAR